MAFVPYIHFQGTCRDAMSFYRDVFGGSDLFVMTYGEAPTGMDVGAMSPEAARAVMHAELTAPGGTLMASDFPPGMPGEAQKAMSIAWNVDSYAGAEDLYEKLRDGGEVIMPFGDTFWADGFGMVKDRFGTHWMISGPRKM